MVSTYGYSKYFLIFFLFIDLVSLNIGILIAHQYVFNFFNFSHDYLLLQLILNIIWVGISYRIKSNRINRNFRLFNSLNKIVNGLVINLFIVFTLWFILDPIYLKKFIFITYLVFTLLIILWRCIWYYFIRFIRLKGYNQRNILVIGSGDIPKNLINYFQSNPQLGYKLVGTIDDDENMINIIEEVAIKKRADIIFCYSPNISENKIIEIIDFAENNLIKVNLISKFSRLGTHNLTMDHYGEIPIINVNTIPLDYDINRIIKRIFDILFSLFVVVIILSWLVPILGLIIKLESKGPIFFKQKRHGKGNKHFFCWKFRTMVDNKNAVFRQAEKQDNRITKTGRFLRKMSIDEFPQFFNVLIGNMSIVGPRPHYIHHNLEYEQQIDRFWQRHAVKPGITGLAQAKGFRGKISDLKDMKWRVNLDHFYVKKWSLLLDCKIIFLTIYLIIRGDKKAY